MLNIYICFCVLVYYWLLVVYVEFGLLLIVSCICIIFFVIKIFLIIDVKLMIIL